MKPPITTDAPAHELKPAVIPAPDGPRLICRARRCGEGIVGAVHGLTGWVGGVHESDFAAGRSTEMAWPLA